MNDNLWGNILKCAAFGVKYLIFVAIIYIGIGVNKIGDDNEKQSQRINKLEILMSENPIPESLQEKMNRIESKLSAQEIEDKAIRAAFDKLKNKRSGE